MAHDARASSADFRSRGQSPLHFIECEQSESHGDFTGTRRCDNIGSDHVNSVELFGAGVVSCAVVEKKELLIDRR